MQVRGGYINIVEKKRNILRDILIFKKNESAKSRALEIVRQNVTFRVSGGIGAYRRLRTLSCTNETRRTTLQEHTLVIIRSPLFRYSSVLERGEKVLYRNVRFRGTPD